MLKLLVFFTLVIVVSSIKFQLSAQNVIVNMHNTLRSKIAKGTYVAKGTRHGPATNMRVLTWDNTLAAQAERHAMSQQKGHSAGCRNGQYGENMWWYFSPTPISNVNEYVAKACAGWESEFQDYGWRNANDLDGRILHATQMAWASSYQIGCGGAIYREGKWNKVMIVCQYKVKGNMHGTPAYKLGRTASDCRFKTGQGLCSKM